MPRLTRLNPNVATVKPPAKLATKFPKKMRAGTTAQLRGELKRKAMATKAPVVGPQTFKLRAPRKLGKKDFAAIANVAKSPVPGEQMIKRERKSPEAFVGTVYSAFVLQNFIEARDAHAQVLKKVAKGPNAKKRKAEFEKDFAKIEKIHRDALKKAGVSASKRADLDTMARDLVSNRKVYSAILDMRAKAQGGFTKAPAALTGAFVPTLVGGMLSDKGILELDVPKNWCGFDPITGTVTKHFSKSFSLKTTIKYPCGIVWKKKWGIPYPAGVKWCSKTITLASGSVSFSLDVGYKIDCCGGTAYGSGEVKACGTVLGKTLCASCEAHIAGTIGAGKVTGSGSRCAYGLGVTAGVSCKLGGYTVFGGNFSFGWVIEAPCPPAKLCA